jgi:hypothetical protein
VAKDGTTASWEYFRHIQAASHGEKCTPRTAFLAVVSAVILAVLGVLMADYLILLSP